MKRTIVLCAVLLAACGGDSERPSTEAGIASDSAALDAVTQPSTTPAQREEARVRSVEGRLNRAEKDAAARQEEADAQVREAEGGASTP